MGFYTDHCSYLPSMAGWFFFSACLSSYNKLVFGAGHLAFPCPLLLTSVHFFIQWQFAYILSKLYPTYFGGDRVDNMSWKTFLGISVPCGVVTAGDVGLSNLSLVRISITFYTMIKSSTPVFVLLWAFVFRIERITCVLVLVVAIIAAGEFLTVLGEIDFDGTGFLLCLMASFLSGARWTLVQLKIQTLDPPFKTAIATMRVLSPSMFWSMLVISIAVERPWVALGRGTDYFNDATDAMHTVGLSLIGAFLAIAMILCELHLIMKSNAIVLMIGGVIKEMITIIVGVTCFGDPLNDINVGGIVVVFMGVILYKVAFHLKKLEKGEQEKDQNTIRRVEYRPVDGESTHPTRNDGTYEGPVLLVKDSLVPDVDVGVDVVEEEVVDLGTLEMQGSLMEGIGRLRDQLGGGEDEAEGVVPADASGPNESNGDKNIV